MLTHPGALLLALCSSLSLAAADDPKEIVRRALQRNSHNEEIARSYTFLQRQENRAFDGASTVRHHDSKTWDVTLLEGSPYRRLVQRDDKPLPPKEEAHEQADLKKSIEQRRKETPEQRQKRIAAWEQTLKTRQDELKEVPDAFALRLVGEERIGGTPAWVIEGTPLAGYKPKTRTTGFLLKMKGRIWISQSDYQPVKIEAETTDTIAIGAFLIRFQKGAIIRAEFTRVNDEVWLPKEVSLTGAARLLLVKGMRVDTNIGFSNYRKFSTDSRVVGAPQ